MVTTSPGSLTLFNEVSIHVKISMGLCPVGLVNNFGWSCFHSGARLVRPAGSSASQAAGTPGAVPALPGHDRRPQQEHLKEFPQKVLGSLCSAPSSSKADNVGLSPTWKPTQQLTLSGPPRERAAGTGAEESWVELVPGAVQEARPCREKKPYAAGDAQTLPGHASRAGPQRFQDGGDEASHFLLRQSEVQRNTEVKSGT